MAYYEGATLKERIEQGPVALDDAVDIATQVGQGLAEAHGAGIVHRDIKPANLLITKGGVVKILDFGLAKLAGTEGVTQTGTTVGTVAYMSPEQARGEEVDQRTDIWSLGVVLYEMLSGQPPFKGENLLALVDSIRGSQPAPLTGTASSATAAVSRALSKDVDGRYQAVTQLVGDLEPGRAVQATSESDVPSIAVLPFADMSPEKDQDYFCEGMAEEIINALTKLDGLKVASRTSAFQFKGQSDDIRRIGDALNVTSVLEGSVRTAGTRLRVMAQLVSIADGYQLWSERYDRQMEDVFDIQDDISHAIVEALRLKLVSGAEIPRVRRHTDDLDAYHLYLQGRHQLFSRYRGGIEKARRCFEQAIEKDPSYAPAHAGIAQVYVIFGIYGFMPPKAAYPRAKAAAKRALADGVQLADAHVALGMVGFAFDWDWDSSDEAFVRAIELDPNNALAFSWHAVQRAVVGRHAEALAAATRGQQLDPLSPYANSIVGLTHMLGRQHQLARAVCQHVLDKDPNFIVALYVGAYACDALGLYDEAIAHIEKAVSLSERLPCFVGMLGQVYAHAGRREDAEVLLRELEMRFDDEYVPPTTVSWIAMALDDPDRAFEWLEHEYRDRGIWLYIINEGVMWDDYRSDPRFQALLQKMHFPAAQDD